MPSTARKAKWANVFRARMRLGLEPYRNGGCTDRATTFGHLKARAHGGHFTKRNITLLCPRCNVWQSDARWPWLKSLEFEYGLLALHRFVTEEATRLEVYTPIHSGTFDR